MLEKILKKLQHKQEQGVPTAKKPDEDFIPYVCHFDPNTILTKNGELLQIIRVTGFGNGGIASDLTSLRDTVRDAIVDHVKTTKFAFWFSTIRRKKNITPKERDFPDLFSQKLDQVWVEDNKWDDQYVNEFYITIIIEGLDTSIVNFNGFMRSFSHMATRSLHKNFLQNAHTELLQVVNGILKELEDYGGKLLGLKEWDGILYSEPMRFFAKLINLYEERYPLSANDISNDLASHKVAFGNRELEVVGYNNKNFAALLSIKEYFEVSLESLDRILQLPTEFIVTQSFDFAYNKKQLEPFEYQDRILQVSGDDSFRELSGIANFMESKHDLPTDYGQMQTTVMLISKTIQDLENDVKKLFEQFSALGILAVREDIFLEHCFWAQLPANFRYLRRQKILNTYRVAGFAALHSFPAGSFAGNHWGSALTVFRTVLDTPYFFNFHKGDSGNTLIIGDGKNRNILLNFLVAQARRFKTKLFYFDSDKSAKCLIKVLGGKYYDILEHDENNPEFLKLNPLSLPKTNENKDFLAEFFFSLIAFLREPISDDEINMIPQIIERIYVSNATDLTSAVQAFNTPETRTIYERLKIWSEGKLNYIFNSKDEINWAESIIGFDCSDVIKQKPILIPIVNYLLYRIEAALDGSPTIIVLNEAWDMLDNIVVDPKLRDVLDRIKSKNAIIIFTAKNSKEIAESEFTKEIRKDIATEIFMPNKNADESYKKGFGLNDEEVEILKVMEGDENHFLFKHDSDSVIAMLNFHNREEYLKILCADEVVLTAMEEIIAASNGDDIKIWLPQLLETLKELENDRLEQERQRLREEAAERRKEAKARQDGDY